MSTTRLQSDVTGVVWKVDVREGEAVQAGQVLMVLESMKMEIPVTALRAGTVLKLLVEEGGPVAEGQDVVVIG